VPGGGGKDGPGGAKKIPGVAAALLLPYFPRLWVRVKKSRQVRLLCPWARHLAGLPLPLNG